MHAVASGLNLCVANAPLVVWLRDCKHMVQIAAMGAKCSIVITWFSDGANPGGELWAAWGANGFCT